MSYAFLHGTFFHLFFNMLGLWMFGARTRAGVGRARATCRSCWPARSPPRWSSLLVTALMGSMAPTIGASGALYGLLLSFGMLFPDRIIVPLIPPIPMKAKYFVAIFGGPGTVLGLQQP